MPTTEQKAAVPSAEESQTQSAESALDSFGFSDIEPPKGETPEGQTKQPEGDKKPEGSQTDGEKPDESTDTNETDDSKSTSEDIVDPDKIREEIAKVHKLDPELAKNPAITKRYGEMVEGILKSVTTIDEDVKWLETQTARVANMIEFTEALTDVDSAAGALRQLAEIAANTVGVPVSKLLSPIDEAAVSSSLEEIMGVKGGDWWESFDSEADYISIKEMVEKAYKSGYEAHRKEAEPIVKSVQDRKKQESEQRQLDTTVAREFPAIRANFDKSYRGFVVTREMLKTAIAEYPQFAQSPEKAIKAKYVEEISNHLQKVTEKPVVTEGLADSSTKGKRKVTDLDEISFSNIDDVV